jgi:NADH-quinone oxidoreductase subunit L/multicomponent Na+:H+ antiporter subunit D
VLNIGYFWPVVYQAFFEDETPDGHDRKPILEHRFGGRSTAAADGGRPSDDGHGDDGHGDAALSGDAARTAGQRTTGDPDGEHAVDRNPSDHTRQGGELGDGAEEMAEHDADADADHHHEGGAPAGGWERRSWLGGESTWFMLGPILAAVAGSLAVGIVPSEAVFLRIVEQVVSAATAAVVPIAGVIA